MDKYVRQIELIGRNQQEMLHKAKVLVVGSGGLGSPTLMALAVSGIGTIGVVDYDVVDITNLNRQIIHDETYLGTAKTTSAEFRLSRMNKDIQINTYNEKLNEDKARIIFPKYDFIVDCVDNYETRKLVSKVAVEFDKTVIEGGIEGFDGYVQIIKPHSTACFNCLNVGDTDIFRQVLGAATGIIGNIQALECIKQIIGLWNGSYSYIAVNMLTYEVDTLRIDNTQSCRCALKSNGTNSEVV